jgi:hypothetical protein
VYLKARVIPKYQLWNIGLIPGTLEQNEANISLECLHPKTIEHESPDSTLSPACSLPTVHVSLVARVLTTDQVNAFQIPELSGDP